MRDEQVIWDEPFNRRRSRGVRIIETGEEFDTIVECARHIGGCASSIARCVRGDRGSHMGFRFERLEETGVHDCYLEWRKKSIYNHRYDHRDSNAGRPNVRIRIIETGEIFNSLAECAMAIDGDRSEISKCLTGYRNRRTYLGLTFERVYD